MSGFILNRGKSFAAKYKKFESKSEEKDEVQQPQQLKGCSSGRIGVIDCEPVRKVYNKSKDDEDDDDIVIDVGLSRTGSMSGIHELKTKSKRGKRNGKKEKRSVKSKKRETIDVKPFLMVPKCEAYESDVMDDDIISDSDGSVYTEGHSEESIEPDLDITLVDTNQPLKERKTDTIELKLKFNGKFNRFTVDYNERILRHLNSFYKSLGVSKRTHELVITYNDKVLTFNESAKSLDLTIVDVLEAYAKERSEPLEKTTKTKVHRDPNSIEIKVRNNQDGRHDQPLIIYLDKNGTMEKLMKQYAEIKKYNLSELIFDFDGEKLTGEETPTDLDMENGSLIDVRIKNK